MFWMAALIEVAGTDLPGSAASCPASSSCSVILTPGQMFALADQLTERRQFLNAETILQSLTRNHDADVRSEARFRLGLLREVQRDWAGAAAAYRELLEEKPNAGPVRLQLARVLMEMGDDRDAVRQFERAGSSGMPADVTRIVNQFQLALRANRRVGGSLELGIVPDSNINLASANGTVEVGPLPIELSPDAKAQSGVGLTLSSQIFWRPRIGNETNLLLTLNGSGNFYRKTRFNDVSAFITAGPELLRGRSRFRLSAIGGQRWFGQKPYTKSYGAGFDWLQQIDSKSQAQLDLSAIHKDYAVNSGLTGTALSAVARYERALSPRLFGRLLVSLARQGARDPAYATWSAGGEVLLSREMGPLSLYGRAGYYRTRADAPFIFPDARRRDSMLDLEAGASFRRFNFWNLSPIIRVSRTVNHSPVFFYDYRRTNVEFGFAREF